MTRSGITIRDVAVLAGVSHQTVSRVINGNQHVRPQTRKQVEAAIRQLDFRPNAAARNMALGRTQTLACIAPNLINFTFASIIHGAETEARGHGYFFLTTSASNDFEFTELIEKLVLTNRVDGLLVINPFADESESRIPAKTPLVLTGATPHNPKVASVNFDDFNASVLATQHLIDLGHRKILHITGPEGEDCSQNRLAGYISTLNANQIPHDASLVWHSDWTERTTFQLLQSGLNQPIPFSAIFAQNDNMAIGAIRALDMAGLRVPEDISVIGIDDIPVAAYYCPPLTTVRQDLIAIGVKASRLIIQLIEDAVSSSFNLKQAGELVFRGSTRSLTQ